MDFQVAHSFRESLSSRWGNTSSGGLISGELDRNQTEEGLAQVKASENPTSSTAGEKTRVDQPNAQAEVKGRSLTVRKTAMVCF